MRKRRRKSRKKAVLSLILLLGVLAFACSLWFGCRNRVRIPTASHAPSPSPYAVSTEPEETAAPATVPPESHPPAPPPSESPAVIKPTPAAVKTPVAAIIIDDLGNNWEMDRRFIEADIPLTLAVLPMCSFSEKVARSAVESGKPVILHLPMEPLSGGNPGPGEIKADMDNRKVRLVLEDDLRSVPGVEGISNHQGSRATAVAAIASAIADIAAEKGLYIIDSLTSSESVLSETARQRSVKTATRRIFLDNRDEPEYIKGQLRELIRMASTEGEALAIGHVRKHTLESIEEMLPAFEAAGVRLVHARDILK
jgi:polysaccharide deacetylase 2 family uncharacterized protein YibQ